MRIEQATVNCTNCGMKYAIQLYQNANSRGWTLFSDGYFSYPNQAPPWHRYKLCPHCNAIQIVDREGPGDGDYRLPCADTFSPRERVRAVLAERSERRTDERRDLLLLDLWISNHICGTGADEITKDNMRELLEFEQLDPIIRADILRQLGRPDEAKDLLLELKQKWTELDNQRQVHIKSLLAFLARGVRSAVPVLTDSGSTPPTGRLALRHVHR